MALRENIDAIKQELSAQEKLLENIIMSERFFKRNKRAIIVAIVALLVVVAGYMGLKTIKNSNIQASNEAYKILYSNPSDETALNTLKSKNKSLYRAFVLQEALSKGDNETLKSLIDEDNSDVIASIAAYYTAGNASSGGDIFKNFIALEDGYNLIKEGRIDEATVKFLNVPTDSVLMSLVKSLEHYKISAQGDKK